MKAVVKNNLKTIGLTTATSIVVANMIGTGVFTSLGFQARDIPSVFGILLLWVVGGVIALCGALTYGELAAALPRSGGEYNFLSKIYHPAVGFLSGLLSATVGFAAPIALAAMALGRYATRIVPFASPLGIALSVTIVISLFHLFNIRLGSFFQDSFTFVKIGLILFLIVLGFSHPNPHPLALTATRQDWHHIFSPLFAVALIYVSYAYSGWNASTYMAGEVKKPGKNLPLSLVAGTLIVLVLYLLLNFVFLYVLPLNELAGKIEIGSLFAGKIFGPVGGTIMAALISVVLISTISAMVMAGPRVTQVMGEDIPLLAFLAKKTKSAVPARAILVQLAIALFLIATSTFEKVLVYTGFILSLSSCLTVFGIFVFRHRYRELARPYKTWGYPVTPVIFLILNIWMLVFLLVNRPKESLLGLATLALGLAIYFIQKMVSTPRKNSMSTS